MADEKPAETLFEISAYVPDGAVSTRLNYFTVSSTASVGLLAEQIRVHWRCKSALKDEDIFLLKCGTLSIADKDEDLLPLNVSLFLRQCSQDDAMKYHNEIIDYFPDGPSPEEDNILDVIVATPAILESPDRPARLPPLQASRLYRDRVQRARQLSRSLLSPSDSVKNERNIKNSIDEQYGIRAHRPAYNYGPHTALFHPHLARLRFRLENLDSLEELEPKASLLSTCHDSIVKSCEVYEKEQLRKNTLKEILSGFIAGDCTWQTLTEDGRAKPDATWGDPVHTIAELKNEPGLGGSATLQGSVAYSKVLVQGKYQNYLKVSNMPAIILGIMGNRFEISTAIYTDGVYVDKLFSEDLILDARQSEQVLRIGRVVKALQLTSEELYDFYRDLAKDVNLLPASTSHLYPNPVPLAENVVIPKLSYLGKLTRGGECLDILRAGDNVKERTHAIYLATMAPQDTDRRRTEAHEILASEGLAPRLHLCVPVIGGLNMIIMDHVEGKPLWNSYIPPDYDSIYDCVEKAVRLLHCSDLVFGDLRTHNILTVAGGGAVLVDFDWVGEHLKDKYPASWDDSKDWAKGVARRNLMEKEHDLSMLEELGKFLKKYAGKNPPHFLFK